MRSTLRVMVPLALGLALSARAQDAASQVFTLEDREVDEALERARTLERQGTFAAAGEEYAKLEVLLEKKREKDPDQRIVTRVAADVDRGVALVLRDRIRGLPEEGLRSYRALVEAKAKIALEDALDAGDQDAVEAVAERFAATQAETRALEVTAELSFEQGDLARAERAARRLEREADDAATAKRWAFVRLSAAVDRADASAAADALATFVAKGGDADEKRIPADGALLSAREAVERARSAAGAAAEKPVDPARLARKVDLDAPELPPELADRIQRVAGAIPAFQQPVFDPETKLLLVCDEKTVRAVDISGGRRSWTYAPKRGNGEPGRLEAATIFPALGHGRIFATLHLNTPTRRVARPAVKPKKGEKAKKDDDEEEVVRNPDWRVVALERQNGKLLWDAAESPGFADFARDAEWVSSPAQGDGQVFVTVQMRKGSDVRCYLVGIDAASGKVRFRAFLASRLPYDFLGIGAPAAAPAVRDGRVYVSTGLGALACVDPTRGQPVWIARYPTTPEKSQPDIVRGERRFRASAPLVRGKLVVVAPVDAQEVFALDPATGARRWSAPRGSAHVVAETPSGSVLIVSDRLLLLDRATGLCRFQGEALGGFAIAAPACFEKEALVPLATALARVSLEDGRVLGRLRYEEAGAEAGALAVCGEGRIATASFARANVYEDASLLAASTKYLDGAGAALLKGESAARRGDLDEAANQLDVAVRDAVSEDTLARARRLAFAVLAEQATRARAAGKRDAFLSACARALGHADQALHDARRAPGTPDTTELASKAATLRRLYADTLFEGTTETEWTKAADELQKLLIAPTGTLVAYEGGLSVDAGAYAKRRLRELVKAHGRACYAMQDGSANNHFRTSQSTGTKEGYERVIRDYPASEKYPQALWELHRFFLAHGLDSDAATALEHLLDEEPGNALAPDALARLALLEERMNRPARARAFGKRLAALGDTVLVHGLDERNATGGIAQAPAIPASALAAQVLARTAVGDPDALARQDAAAPVEPSLRRVFRSTTELSAEGANLVEPRNVALTPPNVYVVRRSATLEVRSTDSGVALAQIDAPQALQADRRWIGWCAGALLVPSAANLSAYDPSSGKLLWRATFPARVGRPAISPDDLHAVEYGDDTAICLTRWNELHAIDAKTGETRWVKILQRGDAEGMLLARGKLAVTVGVYGASTSKLEGLDLDTGKTAWTYTPDVAPGVVSRAGATRWVGAASLACVFDSRRLVLLDRATGNATWSASAGETGWFGDPQSDPQGKFVVARGIGGGPAFWVYDARTGKELWRDDGFGAVVPGRSSTDEGVLPLLDEVIAGETSVYTFRQKGGSMELWSQQLSTGAKLWQWDSHGARGPSSIVETPTSILIARHGRFERAALVSIGKGTGATEEQIPLPGRNIVGRGLLAAGGCVVVSTDRGTFGLTHVDDDRLAHEILEATLDLAKDDTPQKRAALAFKLVRANPPRVEEAIDSCSRALLAEGTSQSPETYDRVFAQLASLSEASIELAQPHYDARRMPRPPEIDGELNDWWRGWSSIDLTGPRYVSPIQLEAGRPGRWTGPEDLSARLYMGWDEKYFYFALDVMDSDLRPYDSESTRWIGDCLLMAFDTKNDGGYWFMPDDVLLSLALTLPKKKKDDDKKDEKQKEKEKEEEEKNKPEGKYFVKRKDDGSGAVYEVQIPWSLFKTNGAVNPGTPGFTFGFNFILTDDDGDRIGPQDLPAGVDPKTLPEGKREGDFRGALKTLQLTPSVLLHERKDRLWQGFIPEYFAKITLR